MGRLLDRETRTGTCGDPSDSGVSPHPVSMTSRALALSACGLLTGCAGAGGAAASLPALGATPPGVRLTTHVVEYPVTAASIAGLRREMHRTGPEAEGRRYAGVTHWQVRWTYQYDRQGIRCALRDVRAHVDARVELPRWDAAGASDGAVVAWWEAFRTRLITHEQGHVRLAVEAGGAVVEALRPLSGGACDALGARANGIGQDLLVRASARQAAYDRDTRHGALPPAPGALLRQPTG
jgi:predicted secreted Zn-dependent protease